jgi:hypothetical protein
MSDDIKRAADSRSRRPRSPRVPVDFFVEMEGLTEKGEPFRVQAEAEKVSRGGGGTFKTDVAIALGTIIRLTPPFGRAIEAEVNGIWINEDDGGQRIGVKLLEPNGWFAD